jgi:hypothetical protein
VKAIDFFGLCGVISVLSASADADYSKSIWRLLEVQYIVPCKSITTWLWHTEAGSVSVGSRHTFY